MVDVVDLFNTCLFIQDNLDTDLSLMFLAQTVGLSRFRFHRVFKAWRGETLHDFVTRMRMEKAAFELSYPMPRSNRKSVKAIAFASGYKSLSSFSHAFSSYAHVSPRQFRYRTLHDRALDTRRAHLAALAGARPANAIDQKLFAPFAISLREELNRPVVVIDSSVPGYKRAQMFSGRSVPVYGIESLPGLFARVQQRKGVGGTRGAPMTALGVDVAEWERVMAEGIVDRKAARRALMTLKGGRYAVIEGVGSVAQLYRIWRLQFDGWLAASGECPRPQEVFAKFPDGAPSSVHQATRVSLYIPLEGAGERGPRHREPVL